MGCFDTITLNRDDARCSEGHDLCGVEFQTKDLGQTMGHYTISTGIQGEDGGWGVGIDPNKPFLGRISVYGTCPQCPALVQADTFNVIGTCVEFEIDIVYGEVKKVVRVSKDTGPQLDEDLKSEWMIGGFGPMTPEEADKFSDEQRALQMAQQNKKRKKIKNS